MSLSPFGRRGGFYDAHSEVNRLLDEMFGGLGRRPGSRGSADYGGVGTLSGRASKRTETLWLGSRCLWARGRPCGGPQSGF